VIVTLGLFYFVINVLMLALAEWVAPDFSINGFWTYVGATIVVSIVSWAMHGIFGMFEGSKKAQLAT
jgi:putative membrane protein